MCVWVTRYEERRMDLDVKKMFCSVRARESTTTEDRGDMWRSHYTVTILHVSIPKNLRLQHDVNYLWMFVAKDDFSS